MVLHDLNLACRYADWVVAMSNGQALAQGRPEDVVTPALVREAFGLDACIVPCPETGTPLMVPLRSHSLAAHRAVS